MRQRTTVALLLAFALGSAAFGQQKTDPGEVTLPLSDYQALVDALAPPLPPPAPEPALSAARLDVVVEDDVARAELRFSARSEKPDRSEISLGADWPAESVTIAPATAILARRDGRLGLELPGAGTWQVLLRSTFPVAAGAETEIVEVPLPALAAIGGTVTARGGGTDIQLRGGMVTARRSSGGVVAVTYAAQGDELVISLRRAGGKHNGGLKLGGTSITVEERVEEGYLRSTATFQTEVESGRLESLDFRYPADCEVLFARGEKFTKYEARGGKLHVSLASAATAESPVCRVVIGLSKKLESGKFVAPAPTFAGPVTYVLAFFPSESVDLSLAEAGGFEDAPAGAAEVPRFADVAEEILMARGTRAPEMPTYLVEKRKEGKVLAVTIPEARFTTLADDKGNVLTEASYVVETRSKAVLKIQLPAGAQFWEADSMGQPLAARADEEGRLILPLASAAARNRVRLLYASPSAPWQPKQKLEAALPAASAPISRATWCLVLPEGWDGELARGSTWTEAGAAPEIAPEAAPESSSSAETGFLSAARGDRLASRKGTRGILVALPAAPARTFSASLIDGAPPPLRLDLKKQKTAPVWQ